MHLCVDMRRKRTAHSVEMCTYAGAIIIKKKTFPAAAELLPAHDKSPPACGISFDAHVEARPDPTASTLSPTT